jgi:hypothetical protein
LQIYPDGAPRQQAASKIFQYVSDRRPIPNVGTLARLRSPGLPLEKLKPAFVVRTPEEFQKQFFTWIAIYFAGFYAVFLVWRWSRFRGDFSLLPPLHVLTGIGLILVISLRDPLRDTLEFSKFAWGVAAGCGVLLLPLLPVFRYEKYSRWCYLPLFAAFGLFALLIAFGSGPEGNDARVNLGPFQPVELIKILLVFFLAGYLLETGSAFGIYDRKGSFPSG